MEVKIIVTGGSGFIGTNLINEIEKIGLKLLNIDIKKPRNNLHLDYWQKTDICNKSELTKVFMDFKPTHVIHLAARADLRGENISDYDANTIGVENVISANVKCKTVRRIIFTSSMLVCETGYIPKDYADYKPSTAYGLSKVQTEKIVETSAVDVSWTIVRPTSIWGPWFGEPYKRFFELLAQNKFVKPGRKLATKTFGYVGNSVDQILKLLFNEGQEVDAKKFYIGDRPAVNISVWADEILAELNKPKAIIMPYSLVYGVAMIGDILNKNNIGFPITTFRLNNMVTDNVLDLFLNDLYSIVGKQKFSRVAGIRETLKWLAGDNIKEKYDLDQFG